MNKNKLVRAMTALCCEPWLLSPSVHKSLTQIISNHAFGGQNEKNQHAAASMFDENPAPKEYEQVNGTAIILCEGVMAWKYSNILYSSGVTSTDIFTRLINKAASDENINSIALVFDSPGGQPLGIPEAARAVKNATEKKPVISFCDGLMCSAAYWVASQANIIYSMESGGIGCIGCYLAFLDESRWYEMNGYNLEILRSGQFKGMGYSGTSLNESQRAMLQKSVDDIANKFKKDIQMTRGKIDEQIMQGQSFSATDALANGLIDEIVDFDFAMADMGSLINLFKKGMK